MDSESKIEEQLIVVSNRLPLTIRRTKDGWEAEKSSGGLATAMEPILERTGGLWIGWPGEAPETPDPGRQKLLAEWAEQARYVSVDLPKETASRFYEGYSNQTLWPLFHHFPSQLKFDPKSWKAYREANERFRDVILEHLRPGHLIWVHDYQLMLLPQLLREAAPEARIGFFLHIPFPSPEVFRLLPRREELLRGLLGADFLAFHTHGYLQSFRASLLRVLGLDSRMDRVEEGGRSIRLEALPIGIAPEEFTALLDGDQETATHLAKLAHRFESQRIVLGVDRLDYTKGIPERLRAFRSLLERRAELRGRVVLIQIAVPSRERISSYRELRRKVSELVGEINGDFGTPDWTPVVYIRRGISRAELVALYAAADVGMVTPLRDGMNLVAKEYVACRRGRDGALVLSEFAGAAAEMGEAFFVNPYDEEQTADALAQALELPLEERRERMAALYKRVVRNNVFAWSERFLSGLREAARAQPEQPLEQPEKLPVATVVDAFQIARRRLLLLDYDGTLVPFTNRPSEAVPPASLIGALDRLAGDPANCVAIVSGRSRADLEGWFGRVRGLWLAAEHGAVMRAPADAAWQPLRPLLSDDWKGQVYPVLEHFADRTPGSFIEEKEYSLVWHYRMSEPDFGDWLANELVATLEEMLAETELRAVRGKKIVEVKLVAATKGEVLTLLSKSCPEPDFLLAVGDDRTDEDLFERMPDTAWTVHVGKSPTRARYRLSDPGEAQRLLHRFCAAEGIERNDQLLLSDMT